MLEPNEQTSKVALMKSSLNRSGLSSDTNQYTEHFQQTESDNQHEPKIRKICNCTDTIKSICISFCELQFISRDVQSCHTNGI